MDLIAKEFYSNSFCTLKVGMSTADFEVPEEVKAQMLADFPDVFEVVGNVPKKVEVVEDVVEVQTPEDGMEVENQEAKMQKTRKK